MNNTGTNNTYHASSPREVFRAISADFILCGMTRCDAEKKLGFKSQGYLSHLLASKKYLSPVQAIRFQKAFGYNLNFLMSGQGRLKDENNTLPYKSMNNTGTNNTCYTSSPREVFRAISADFKLRGMTHCDAAKKLGFKSQQTLNNLLALKKYLSELQAIRFQKAFGYSPNFLMSGQGELKDEDNTLPYKTNHKNSRKELLIAEPGVSELILLRSYFRRVIEAWGNPIAKIILATYQQISACNDVSTLKILASKIEDELYALKEQAALEPDTKPQDLKTNE